jgi:hypothetical protein
MSDSAPLNRKHKLAIYKRIGECSFTTVRDASFDEMDEYVRLTEHIEVEFPALQDDAIIQKHLAALDRTEAAVTAKYFQALANIKQQKEELRAITYQPTEVA